MQSRFSISLLALEHLHWLICELFFVVSVYSCSFYWGLIGVGLMSGVVISTNFNGAIVENKCFQLQSHSVLIGPASIGKSLHWMINVTTKGLAEKKKKLFSFVHFNSNIRLMISSFRKVLKGKDSISPKMLTLNTYAKASMHTKCYSSLAKFITSIWIEHWKVIIVNQFKLKVSILLTW